MMKQYTKRVGFVFWKGQHGRPCAASYEGNARVSNRI